MHQLVHCATYMYVNIHCTCVWSKPFLQWYKCYMYILVNKKYDSVQDHIYTCIYIVTGNLECTCTILWDMYIVHLHMLNCIQNKQSGPILERMFFWSTLSHCLCRMFLFLWENMFGTMSWSAVTHPLYYTGSPTMSWSAVTHTLQYCTGSPASW